MAAHPHHQSALLNTQKGLNTESFKVEPNHAIPTAGTGELLVHVKAAALNPADWKMAHVGFLIQGYPVVLGCDLAGVVSAVGEGVSHYKVGDEVYAYTKLGANRQGAFQHFAIVEARMASHKPKAISFAQAATLGVGTVTAADGLFLKGGLAWPGAKHVARPYVLVWGAASSVGNYAVQLAHLAGAIVIATASPKNFGLVKNLGATHVFDYNAPDVIDQIKKVSEGKLHLAYDVISSETAERAATALSEGYASTYSFAFVPEAPGKIIFCAGEPKKLPEHVKAEKVFIAANYELPEYGPSVAKIAALVEHGQIKPNVVELLPGGLNGVFDGLLRLQKGVSGVKLVAEF